LRRIAATVFESDNAFWSNGAKRHISDTFRLWDVTFDAVTDKNGYGSRHRIEFGKLFKRSFEERYLRGLDIEFYWELDSSIAKRLYRLVDLKRAGAASWGTDLFELQKQIPIGPYAYVSKIKEKLKAAHDELIERGFLSAVTYRERSEVLYEVSKVFRIRRKGLELAGTQEEVVAIQLLTRSGLRGDVARDLVAKYGPAHCTRYANALPYQTGLRNPAGWLRRAIEQEYELLDILPVPNTSSDVPSPPSVLESGVDHTASAEDSHQLPDALVSQGEDPDQETPVSDLAPDPQARASWEALVADLVALRGQDSLPPWFDQLEGGLLDGATLTVLVPNSTAANYLNDHFGADLVSLWQERVGDEAFLQVATDLSTGTRAALTG
jgi:hypothetical protein